MSNRVSNFTLHNARGESLLPSELFDWSSRSSCPFNVSSYSWVVDGVLHSQIASSFWRELPDATGFICFEPRFEQDNCCVIDAYAQQRYRLTVPWELTPYDVPSDAKMWFRNIGTHSDGKFGVTAWIEYAGDFYFELDYHRGSFLWGKEIRF